MSWRITFYNKKVKLQGLAFPEGILASFLHIAELIEEFGPKIGIGAKTNEGGNGMNRPSFKELKKEALSRPEVKAEYERLAPAYLLRKKLIGIRIAAGFTQDQMARALKTQKSNISRLENVDSKVSPTLSTIERYAQAAGYRLEISFLPETHGK